VEIAESSEDRLQKISSFILEGDLNSLDLRMKMLNSVSKSYGPFTEYDYEPFLRYCRKSLAIPTVDTAFAEFEWPHPLWLDGGPVGYDEANELLRRVVEAEQKKSLLKQVTELAEEGAFEDLSKIQDRLKNVKSSGTLVDDYKDLNGKALYESKRDQPAGLLTFMTPIDNEIGGMDLGTMMTVMGFVGAFKTTFALNMLYNNFLLGYKIMFVTLEVPRDLLYYNLLSRHSFHKKFLSLHGPVESKKIRKGTLTSSEEEFVFDVVEKDLLENEEYGKFYFMEEGDFSPNIDVMNIERRIDEVGHVDGLIIDYIQLLQYVKSSYGNSGMSLANNFINEFKNLSINCNGKRTRIILLSQANRDGWTRAGENNGQYDLRALSELRELERASSYVMYLYSDEDLKNSGELKTGLLKHRGGDILPDPIVIGVDPRYALIGEEIEGYGESAGGDSTDFTSLIGGDDWD